MPAVPRWAAPPAPGLGSATQARGAQTLQGAQRRAYFSDRDAEQKDRVPGRNGYSSGRWEGDTLVVETDNLVKQIDSRYPHSENAKIIERYTVEGKDEQGRRILRKV